MSFCNSFSLVENLKCELYFLCEEQAIPVRFAFSTSVVYSMHTLVDQTAILAKKRGGNNWLPRKKRGGNNWLNGVSLVHSPLENFYGTY